MEEFGYGNWVAVVLNVALLSAFTLGPFLPLRKRDWRSAGVLQAFIVALFTEMYGFPLTVYLLSSFLGVPLSFSHLNGHLLGVLLGVKEHGLLLTCQIGGILMLLGGVLIFLGWVKICGAKGEIVTDNVYRYVRHPQYLGLMILTLGTLVQWPTLITVPMWPFLSLLYYRLAKKEEKELEERFGSKYTKYKQAVPMLIPFPQHIR